MICQALGWVFLGIVAYMGVGMGVMALSALSWGHWRVAAGRAFWSAAFLSLLWLATRP